MPEPSTHDTGVCCAVYAMQLVYVCGYVKCVYVCVLCSVCMSVYVCLSLCCGQHRVQPHSHLTRILPLHRAEFGLAALQTHIAAALVRMADPQPGQVGVRVSRLEAFHS